MSSSMQRSCSSRLAVARTVVWRAEAGNRVELVTGRQRNRNSRLIEHESPVQGHPDHVALEPVGDGHTPIECRHGNHRSLRAAITESAAGVLEVALSACRARLMTYVGFAGLLFILSLLGIWHARPTDDIVT